MALGTTGKAVRIARIFGGHARAVVVPIDDALIAGPTGQLANLDQLLNCCEIAGCDSVLGYVGGLRAIRSDAKLGRILNLTTSTALSRHTRKMIALTVDDAIRIGADGVAVHLNLTSKYEPEMLANLGRLVSQADRHGLVSVAIVYPRAEKENGDENYDDLRVQQPSAYSKLVAHCARVAMEMGADIVKTRYTGSPDSFSEVVAAARDIPVFVAGGPLLSSEQTLKLAEDAINAGAKGISIGRNIHQRPLPEASIVQKLTNLVHRDNRKDSMANCAE
jgi:DhnA family fructose-bisphosphate aldolase class Ia